MTAVLLLSVDGGDAELPECLGHRACAIASIPTRTAPTTHSARFSWL